MKKDISIEEVKEKVKNSKAFLFDFDGTLVNLDKLHVEAFGIVFKEMYGLDFTREEFMRYISGRGSKNGLSEYLGVNGIEEFSADDINNRFYKEKDRLLKDRSEEEVYLLPGIRQFLEIFKDEKYRKIIVTSSREENVQNLLTHFGVFGYFEKVFDRFDVVRGKPDPQAYLNAIEYTGLNVDDCIAFEDSFYGLQSATGAELFTIGILNPGWNDDFVHQLADCVVESYLELV